MPRTESRKARLNRFLSQSSLSAIDEAAWRQIRDAFPDVSPGALRRLLRQSAASVEAPYAGVDQSGLDELEHSLRAIGDVYAAAKSGGRPDKARLCRDIVIEAKDHARLASRNSKVAQEKRLLKQEMSEWMLVWLEDPAMFPAWVELRKAASG